MKGRVPTKPPIELPSRSVAERRAVSRYLFATTASTLATSADRWSMHMLTPSCSPRLHAVEGLRHPTKSWSEGELAAPSLAKKREITVGEQYSI